MKLSELKKIVDKACAENPEAEVVYFDHNWDCAVATKAYFEDDKAIFMID